MKTLSRRHLSKIERQAASDAQHEADKYTGAAYDLTTGDWQIWANGSVIGYAPSLTVAQRASTEALANSLGRS